MSKLPACTQCFKKLDKNTLKAWAIPKDIHGMTSPFPNKENLLMTAICPDCYKMFIKEMDVANGYVDKVFDGAVAKNNLVYNSKSNLN